MEVNPIFPSPEDDDESSDSQEKKDKKKIPSLAEFLLKEEEDKTKEKTGLDIAQALFEDPKPKDEAETDQSIIELEDQQAVELQIQYEAEPVALSPEEVGSINQALAEEHLQNPVTEDPPLPPVNEFLELVVSGVEPETAYTATKIAHQLDDGQIEQLPPQDNRPAIRISEAAPITLVNQEPAETYRSQASFSGSAKKEAPPYKKTGSKVAPKLASIIFKQRQTNSKKQLSVVKVAAKEKQLEGEVSGLEAKLTTQEVTLQQLSRQKEIYGNANVTNRPFERVQPGRSESRLEAIKPERAGHIGKVVVGKERSVAERREPTVITNPEQIKSLRRNELLELSNNVRVDGASLKHMFENNLFDETALRRLVEAHYKGLNILPQLRREILDRQNYFEQDPRLRNQSLSSRQASDELLNQILASTNKQPLVDKPQAAPLMSSAPLAPVATPKSFGPSLANAVLAVIIVLLVGLIAYFALR